MNAQQHTTRFPMTLVVAILTLAALAWAYMLGWAGAAWTFGALLAGIGALRLVFMLESEPVVDWMAGQREQI